MQVDLQAKEHFPHRVQVDASIFILNREYRERNPNTVPTGQTVLQ
jgi:hypothetical protein